jgi:hypothetical protein
MSTSPRSAGVSDGGSEWEGAPSAWYVRAGRVAGAGLTGVLVGAVVAWIWHAGLAGANSGCQDAGDNICLDSLASVAETIAGIVMVTIAGVSIGFAALRIRPLALTVSAGFLVAVLLVWNVTVGTGRVGSGPPGWATALAVGSGLAAVALSADWGKAQKVGVFVLGAIIVASIIAR